MCELCHQTICPSQCFNAGYGKDDVPLDYCRVCGRSLFDIERVIIQDSKTYCEDCYEKLYGNRNQKLRDLRIVNKKRKLDKVLLHKITSLIQELEKQGYDISNDIDSDITGYVFIFEYGDKFHLNLREETVEIMK